MKDRYRLHRRANGMCYLHDRKTGSRESLNTKDEGTALKLIQAKNQAFSQPTFNREMAKVFLKAQDPKFCERTWHDVANLIDAAYEGSTKSRFGKFVRSVPMQLLVNLRLIDTTADDFLSTMGHEKAGVSTNVQLRILHNRALDLGWILAPVLSRKAWPKVKYRKRRGITLEEHTRVLEKTGREDYRLFFELLWETGGSQSDIASLCAEDIDWENRRLFYERQKLASRNMGRACIAIGSRLESILLQLPKEGHLFPNLTIIREGHRAWYFCRKRRLAGIEEGIVLHSYRYAWAERAQAAGMPEREAMAHLGHGSKAVHRAYARSADRVTMPLEYYEDQAKKKVVDFTTGRLKASA